MAVSPHFVAQAVLDALKATGAADLSAPRLHKMQRHHWSMSRFCTCCKVSSAKKSCGTLPVPSENVSDKAAIEAVSASMFKIKARS